MTLAAQQAAPASQPAVITSTTEVDGVALRVRSSLAKRAGASVPVVVFESGAGMPLETWDPVFEKVAAFAPVMAYDRSGTGQSPWDGQSPLPQRANQRLRKLLESLGVAPPFILVGHSWGGALARYFAGEYPQMVKGILYIDPTDVTMTEPLWQQMFASFGATANDLAAFFEVMDTSTRTAPAAVRAEALVMMDLLRTRTLEERHLKPVPKIPSSVLLASRVASLPKGLVPFDGDAYARALQSARVDGLRQWAQDSGRYLVVDGAGHFVHRDAPDVLVREIRSLVDSARAQ
ncbi:MAG: alpha/beta hydrolase [Acidobacteriota bacterium]|nr:alpha/beta hydrolase [Acidobacteriota bacterium]